MSKPFLALLLLALSAHSQQPPTFKISGHVVRDSDHRPIRNARVSITMVEKPDVELSLTTNESGEFLFDGLTAAKYNLQVTYRGQSQLFQQLDGYTTAIATGPSLDSEHILFTLQTPSTIGGTVLDDEAEPIRGAIVYLFGGGIVQGKQTNGLRDQQSTDPDGHFQFKNLQHGVYSVAAAARPWYAQNPSHVIIDGKVLTTPTTPELDVVFPLTYYAAGPIELKAGTKSEIDLRLQAVPALHIGIDGVEKSPDQNVQAQLMAIGPGGVPVSLPFGTGVDEISGVPPGTYRVSSYLNGKHLGSQTVTLVSDSTIHLNESIKTSLSGKVTIADGNLPPGLSVFLPTSVTGQQSAANVSPDGQFEFPDLAEGHYDLRYASPEVYIQKLSITGGSFANGELTIPYGAQVKLAIQIAKGLSNVSGIVLQNHQPVPGAIVLLIPQDRTYSNFIPRDQSDSDGTFTLNFARPGRYTLIAIDDGRDLAYADPSVIQPYLQHGQLLDLPLPKDAHPKIEVQPRLH